MLSLRVPYQALHIIKFFSADVARQPVLRSDALVVCSEMGPRARGVVERDNVRTGLDVADDGPISLTDPYTTELRLAEARRELCLIVRGDSVGAWVGRISIHVDVGSSGSIFVVLGLQNLGCSARIALRKIIIVL